METQNETKVKKFFQKVMEHLNPVIKTDDDKLRELIKGVIQSSMEWKDEQHAQEKRQWIEKMLTLINVTKSETAKECKRTKFKQNLKIIFRNSIERILDATEKMCVIILVLFIWLCAIGLVVVGINALINLI